MKNPVEQMMEQVEWEPIVRDEAFYDDGTPFATHTGVLWIGACAMVCHQLNTGVRVIDERSMAAFFNGDVSRQCPLCKSWIYVIPEVDAFAKENDCEIACEGCIAKGAA